MEQLKPCLVAQKKQNQDEDEDEDQEKEQAPRCVGPKSLLKLATQTMCLLAESRPDLHVRPLVEKLGYEKAVNLLLKGCSMTQPSLFTWFRSQSDFAHLCPLWLYLWVLHNHEELALVSIRPGKQLKDLPPFFRTMSKSQFVRFLNVHRRSEEQHNYIWKGSLPDFPRQYHERLQLVSSEDRAWPPTIEPIIYQLYSDQVLPGLLFPQLNPQEEKEFATISFSDAAPDYRLNNLLPRATFFHPQYKEQLEQASWRGYPTKASAFSRPWLRVPRNIPQPAEGTLAVTPSLELFTRNFHEFTNGVFRDWTNWKGFLVTGGAVVASLLPTPADDKERWDHFHHSRAWSSSDVDIHVYGLEEWEFRVRLLELSQHFSRLHPDVVIAQTAFTITFALPWPSRKIQVVLGKWKTKAEIIFEADVDCTAVGFDGKQVWISDRGRLGLAYRSLWPCRRLAAERGWPEYEMRLYKYSRRGFYIADYVFAKPLSAFYSRYAMQRPDSVISMQLLLAAFQHPNIESTISSFKDAMPRYSTANSDIIYGPDVTQERVLKHVTGKRKVVSSYGPMWVPSRFKHVPNSETREVFSTVELQSFYGNPFSPRWRSGCSYNYLLAAQEVYEFGSIATKLPLFHKRTNRRGPPASPHTPVLIYEFDMPGRLNGAEELKSFVERVLHVCPRPRRDD